MLFYIVGIILRSAREGDERGEDRVAKTTRHQDKVEITVRDKEVHRRADSISNSSSQDIGRYAMHNVGERTLSHGRKGIEHNTVRKNYKRRSSTTKTIVNAIIF